jgi:tetratricopeptide (TPR) repeat protein
MTEPSPTARVNFFLQNRRWADAEAAARALIATQPDLAVVYYQLATALQQQFRREEAVQAADEACRLAPNNPIFLRQRSNIAAQMGDAPTAIAAADRAVTIAPLEWQSHATLSQAHLTVTDHRTARSVYDAPSAVAPAEEAVRLAPHESQAHYVLGRALNYNGKRKAARRSYQRALELEPNATLPLNNLGWLELKRRPIKAAKLLTAAARRDPQDTNIHTNLGAAIHMWLYRTLWVLLWTGGAAAALRPFTSPRLIEALLGAVLLGVIVGTLLLIRALPKGARRSLWRYRPVVRYMLLARITLVALVDIVIVFGSGSVSIVGVFVLLGLMVMERKVSFTRVNGWIEDRVSNRLT